MTGQLMQADYLYLLRFWRRHNAVQQQGKLPRLAFQRQRLLPCLQHELPQEAAKQFLAHEQGLGGGQHVLMIAQGHC